MSINDAIAEWIVGIFAELGDPEKVGRSAQPLVDHATEIRTVHAELAAMARSVSWSGAAAEAHAAQLQLQLRIAEETAEALDKAQAVVAEHANKGAYIAKQVVGVILEIIEVLLAGLMLTWFFSFLANLVWLRLAPLFQRVLDLLMRLRTSLREFTASMSELGVVAGRLAQEVETMIVAYLPAYSRALPGFYIGAATPQLLSGRPVNWRENAWQVALFGAFDLGLNMVEGVFDAIRLGIRLREVIVRGGDRAGQMLTFSRGRPDPVSLPPDTPIPPRDVPTPSPAAGSETRTVVDDVPAPTPSVSSMTARPSLDDVATPSITRPDTPVPPAERPVTERPVTESEAGPGIHRDNTSEASPALDPRAADWEQFVPKTPGEALYIGLKEAFNTGVGNTMLAAAAADIKNQKLTPEDFALSFALGFALAGARDGLLHHLPVGYNWAFRQQPQGAPAVQRWLASIPTQYSFYAMYFVAKDAILNAILGRPVDTQLNPASR